MVFFWGGDKNTILKYVWVSTAKLSCPSLYILIDYYTYLHKEYFLFPSLANVETNFEMADYNLYYYAMY